MGRYAVTLVFDVGGGRVPRGVDVVEHVPLPDRAVHRYSSCDGSTLTVVVDFRSAHPASVCRQSADAVSRSWAEITGVPPGPPLQARVRPLRPPRLVAEGVGGPREYAWRPDGDDDGRLVLVDRGSVSVARPALPRQRRRRCNGPSVR